MGRPVPTAMEMALDAEGLRGELETLAKGRWGPSTRVKAASVEVVHRRVLRYELALAGTDESLSTWRMIGKVHERPEVGRRAYEAWRGLWESGFTERTPERVSIPEPYGYLPGVQLMLMEEVPGDSLKELVRKRAASPEQVRLFAEGMVKLHSTTSPIREPFTVNDHLRRRCLPAPEAVAAAFPDLAGAIAWVLDTARQTEKRQPQDRLALAHGDFHFGQANVEDDRMWILDLDALNYGDPAYDLAMVFMVLKRQEQKEKTNKTKEKEKKNTNEKKTKRLEYIRSLRDAFLTTYFDRMDRRIAARIPLHEALIHLKRACKRFRWQDETGWEDQVRRLVRQTVVCLEAMPPEAEEPRTLDDVVALYDRCPGCVV